jgi:hypothetical protein
MAFTRTIPVRLTSALLDRLDAVAERNGTNRASIIRFTTQKFLDYCDRTGQTGLPDNWKEILADMDGRRAGGRWSDKEPLRIVAARSNKMIFNDAPSVPSVKSVVNYGKSKKAKNRENEPARIEGDLNP